MCGKIYLFLVRQYTMARIQIPVTSHISHHGIATWPLWYHGLPHLEPFPIRKKACS